MSLSVYALLHLPASISLLSSVCLNTNMREMERKMENGVGETDAFEC